MYRIPHFFLQQAKLSFVFSSLHDSPLGAPWRVKPCESQPLRGLDQAPCFKSFPGRLGRPTPWALDVLQKRRGGRCLRRVTRGGWRSGLRRRRRLWLRPECSQFLCHSFDFLSIFPFLWRLGGGGVGLAFLNLNSVWLTFFLAAEPSMVLCQR